MTMLMQCLRVSILLMAIYFSISLSVAQDTKMTLPDGFKVEKLYQVPKKEQGSWVSMAWDDKGRLITSVFSYEKVKE